MRRLASSVWLFAVLAVHTGCSNDGSPANGASGSGAGGASAAGALAANAGSPSSSGGATAQAGASSAGGGVVNSGEATIASLTPEQFAAVCTDQRASFTAAGVEQKYEEYMCRSVGILAASSGTTDAEVQKLCRDAYTRCSVNPPVATDVCANNKACTATVANYKACVAEYPGYLDQFIAGLPLCALLTKAELQAATNFVPTEPPACAGVWKLCRATF